MVQLAIYKLIHFNVMVQVTSVFTKWFKMVTITEQAENKL